MRKAVGVLLITLLLGSMVAAAGNTAYATTVEAQNDPYEKFWEILNKEAELVVKFNHTGDVLVAQELIQNSRLGAENAANISALIWQAMEELKASGVKTYYTAEELREMAQNISQNGLPQETVEALKAQGWTDEQIQALEDYIVKNADEINEDFNMTSFLENFSMAFIDVAFKYNEYEIWTLKKWKWANPQEVNTSLGNPAINPVLADEWLDLYLGYSEGNCSKMKSAAEKLRDKMYDMIVGKTLNKEILTELKEHGDLWQLMKLRKDVYVMWWLKNGGVVFRAYNSADNSSYGVYYWPNATTAYELVGNIMTLVKSKNLGNNNPEVQKMLNQKVAELKDALTVIIVSTNNSMSQVPVPDKPILIKPIKPIPPIEPNPPIEPVSMGSAETTMEASYENAITVTPADDLALLALTPENKEGVLKINGIKVVVDSNVPGRVEYHVEVKMSAENNAINNIKIHVNDYTSGGSDSGSISFLNSGETYTWESKRFSVTHTMDGELHVSGKVEVTYTPSCGAVPLLQESPEASSTPSSCEERTIQKEYSTTVDLTSSVDWSKIYLTVEASRTSITEGESVTYRIVVRNENDAPLEGLEYSITIQYSPTNSRTYSGTVDVPENEEKVLLEQTVHYEDASTYTTHASIYWNGKSKSAETSVTVTSDQNDQKSINGAFSFSPSVVYMGDTVTFHYVIATSEGQLSDPTVTLEIDNGQKIVEKTYYGVTISPDSHLEDHTTYVFNKAGTYRITLKVNGLPLYSKTIEVKTPPGLALSLECPNEPVLLGETGICNIIVKKNILPSDVPYAITAKTLDGDIDTSSVISTSIIKDVIPAGFTGKIAEVFIPLDERMAEALELNDVRDLTPRINTWVCENGYCHYTLERIDTPHCLKLKIRLNLGEYMSLDGIITARYTGSKYWNSDANRGVAIGVSSLLAIAFMPEIATAAESAGTVAGGKAVIKYSLAPGGTLDFLLNLADNIRAADNKVEEIKESVKSIIKRYIGW